MVTLTRENQHDDSLLPDLANNIIYPIIRSTSKKPTNKKTLNLGSKNGSLVGCFTYHDGNMVETSKPWLFHRAGPQRPPFPPPGQPQRSASPAGNRHKHHQGIKTIHVFGKKDMCFYCFYFSHHFWWMTFWFCQNFDVLSYGFMINQWISDKSVSQKLGYTQCWPSYHTKKTIPLPRQRKDTCWRHRCGLTLRKSNE